MNNLEKIKNMTLDEMTEWIERINDDERDDHIALGCFRCCYYGTHHCPKDCNDCEWLGGIKQWLKREADED